VDPFDNEGMNAKLEHGITAKQNVQAERVKTKETIWKIA
jgi:hypothetical protein